MTRMKADIIFAAGGPPNSPPSVALLSPKMTKQVHEVIKKSMTEKAKLPGGVS